ncbi:MAG: MmsAB operon regulatory protein [Porticoccaceae bacterium]|nr:MAG: MmsAB operon regulatory protein [Porticoccaceae bacterium]
MSQPSDWPLDERSRRVVSPVVIRRRLARHPLARDCFPLACGYYERAYGHRMSRSRHDDNLLIYCFAGRGLLEAEGRQLPVGPGDLVVLPPGVGHCYRAAAEDPWSIYWCHFSGERARDYLALIAPPDRASVVPIGLDPTLRSQFQALLEASCQGFDLLGMLHAANMLKPLLTGLAVSLERARSHRRRDFDLRAVQAFMLQNLDKRLDLETLARQAGLSRYHFARRYREAAGQPPIRHLIRMRMEYARYLLETSDSTLAEVAAKVGLDDPLYFSRQFKQVFGVSPAGYRSSHRRAAAAG